MLVELLTTLTIIAAVITLCAAGIILPYRLAEWIES